MPKPFIAFDIDGVIVDWFGEFLDFCNQELGKDYRYDEMSDYDFSHILDISKSEINRLIKKRAKTIGNLNLRFIEESKSVINLLRKKYQIVFITSRRDELRDETNQWGDIHFKNIPIFYASGSNNPYGGGTKRFSKQQIADELSAKCLVEDNPHEFEIWNTRTTELICYPQPWNRHIIGFKRMNWQEIKNYLL